MSKASLPKEWTDENTERHVMQAFEWRKLNYRRPYDRAVAAVFMTLERETSLCAGLPACRVIAFGLRKGKTAIEIRHHKTKCLAERMRKWK